MWPFNFYNLKYVSFVPLWILIIMNRESLLNGKSVIVLCIIISKMKSVLGII